jgi:hypothetical protein
VVIKPIPATTASSPKMPCAVGVSRSRMNAPIDDSIGPVPRAIG